MLEMALRILCLCIALAGAETLHGIGRVKFLVPRVGVKVAQRISIVTGSMLAFLVCYLLVPHTGLHGFAALLILGVFLALFMAAFDVAIARFVAKRPWSIVLMDFNPTKGGLLVFGLAFLTLAPLLTEWIRR
ncbi:MAG TPA: hypothetical protein VJ505_16135 [Holophagaceae bacterium]|nr:hypothetical protein [Holophagaceae bacterium]